MNRIHPNWQTAIAIAALLGCFFLAQWLDGPSEMQSQEDGAAAFRDALAHAQQERPDLWTPERRARADVAAGMAARGVQP